VFVSSDEVDNLWGRIVKSTLAGTLGISAKVSTRDEEDARSRHVICVYNLNADYRSMADVNRVRDHDGLPRLGVKELDVNRTFIHIVAYIITIAGVFRHVVTILDRITELGISEF
jgi:hypothetical protein